MRENIVFICSFQVSKDKPIKWPAASTSSGAIIAQGPFSPRIGTYMSMFHQVYLLTSDTALLRHGTGYQAPGLWMTSSFFWNHRHSMLWCQLCLAKTCQRSSWWQTECTCLCAEGIKAFYVDKRLLFMIDWSGRHACLPNIRKFLFFRPPGLFLFLQRAQRCKYGVGEPQPLHWTIAIRWYRVVWLLWALYKQHSSSTTKSLNNVVPLGLGVCCCGLLFRWNCPWKHVDQKTQMRHPTNSLSSSTIMGKR